MVKRLDEAFGRMMDALDSLGLRENTIVLFTSDHGCHFKTRNNEYKRSAHEASIRIPTLLTGGPFKAGGDRPELVNLVDLPTTLVDAAGIDIPDTFEGQRLLPRIQRQGADWAEDVFIQISEAESGRALRTDRWKYAVRVPGSGQDERTEDFEMVASPDRYGELALYDLREDPYELRNLIASQAHDEEIAGLRERLLGWIERVEGKRPTIETHGRTKLGQTRVNLES
jgi:arylsulfatase A-like enzyme